MRTIGSSCSGARTTSVSLSESPAPFPFPLPLRLRPSLPSLLSRLCFLLLERPLLLLPFPFLLSLLLPLLLLRPLLAPRVPSSAAAEPEARPALAAFARSIASARECHASNGLLPLRLTWLSAVRIMMGTAREPRIHKRGSAGYGDLRAECLGFFTNWLCDTSNSRSCVNPFKDGAWGRWHGCV